MALLDYTPIKDDAFFATLHTDTAAWFAEHNMNPNVVPLDSRIVLDTGMDTGVWRFTEVVREDGGTKVCADGEVATREVLRVFKSLPPWVEHERRELADVLGKS